MTDLMKKLCFPAIWSEKELYPEELRVVQEAELRRNSPGEVVNDSEHYRYSAFLYYVKRSDTTPDQLRHLVKAASQDSDPVMAQAALIDMVSHASCTDDIYIEALKVFRGFDEQYMDEEMMNLAYREKIPSWKQ